MEQVARLLLIDDDNGSREGLSLLLKREGYLVDDAAAGEEALRLMGKNTYDVIITDLFLPGVSGIDILKRAKEMSLPTNVILITGNATAETAVEAMKEGAFDYITKPVNFDKLKILLVKAVEKSLLIAENLYLRQQLRGKYKFTNIIGNSPAIQPVFSRMEKILQTDSTVLILGESGTGKELVARAIHFNGTRKDKPFITINCGAIPADLLESELFGHVRGSFTGAIADKPGKFELANLGTIFLDEIGTMPMHLQMKLLRVLQEQELERVGSTRKMKLDVRVISATNANLENLVERGLFREDLYYRLNVIPIQLPPLRDRREDIALLAKHFLRKTCQDMRRPAMNLSPQALRALEGYNWPGNVREMENVIERAVALSDGDVIDCADLPPKIGGAQLDVDSVPVPQIPDDGLDLSATIEEIERALIDRALLMSKGVKAKAANLLRINRTTLVEKIKRFDIQ
ncbi:MAG: sigma-54-dependent Fis family transcriptional regulator [Deltaproteobacteria bacterium]|jgi:DNA-binding NtrC family response regulator|nr:sigma-54-dependent Fis family transcriptional regulator [Deltaproteobacteria bacterium]